MCIQKLQLLSSFSLHCGTWWILFWHHCPVSSAGGLSCKHLSKGDHSSLSFSKALNRRPEPFFRGFFPTPLINSPSSLTFCFLCPAIHWPFLASDQWWLCPRDASGSVLASQGYRWGRKEPADLLVSLALLPQWLLQPLPLVSLPSWEE